MLNLSLEGGGGISSKAIAGNPLQSMITNVLRVVLKLFNPYKWHSQMD